MKVLFIHAGMNGLPAEYTVHATLAASAVPLGVESAFLCQAPVDQSVLASAGLDDVSVHDFGRNLTMVPKPSRQRRAWLVASRFPASLATAKRTIERFQPDVIYTSQQQMDVCLAQLCSRRLGIPHLVHLHYSVGPWIGATTLRVISRIPRKFAVSEYVRQTAMLRGSTPESVTTILNPLPFTHVDVDEVDRSRVRASIGVPSDAPVVLAAGRLDPGKGHVALLDAFKLVLERIPNARLVICGGSGNSEDYPNALRKQAEDLGIDRSTVFAGWRGDMAQIYRAADVFCLPSEMEPCALVYLEAMGAGLPVVGVYSGGTPELVQHERTGLLAYPKDPVALACHMTRLLSDPALAREFGAAGRQRAERDFDSRAVAQRWVGLLADVI